MCFQLLPSFSTSSNPPNSFFLTRREGRGGKNNRSAHGRVIQSNCRAPQRRKSSPSLDARGTNASRASFRFDAPGNNDRAQSAPPGSSGGSTQTQRQGNDTRGANQKISKKRDTRNERAPPEPSQEQMEPERSKRGQRAAKLRRTHTPCAAKPKRE